MLAGRSTAPPPAAGAGGSAALPDAHGTVQETAFQAAAGIRGCSLGMGREAICRHGRALVAAHGSLSDARRGEGALRRILWGGFSIRDVAMPS